MKLFHYIVACSIFLLYACGADSGSEFVNYPSKIPKSIAFMHETSRTLPPYGYVNFCMYQSRECAEWQFRDKSDVDIRTTASISSNQTGNIPSSQNNYSYNQIIANLEEINNIVNIAVRPVSDPDGFGVTELWRIPDITTSKGDIGDCEDYALLKRKLLSQEGYKYNNLSVAVVKQYNGMIHAVLVVRTDYGDFVLDNLESNVKHWSETSYIWVKKQSVHNPAIWVDVS